jgi:hypothetical protein
MLKAVKMLVHRMTNHFAAHKRLLGNGELRQGAFRLHRNEPKCKNKWNASDRKRREQALS